MTILGPRRTGDGDSGSGAHKGRAARPFRRGRRVTAVVGACLIVGSLTTVAANASGASTRTSHALSGTLTMNVFTFSSPVLKPVIAAFEKLNPGVKIQAANVVNTSYETHEIESAIRHTQTDKAFREACSRAVNPFGDGLSSQRIVRILLDILIDDALLDKQTIY